MEKPSTQPPQEGLEAGTEQGAKPAGDGSFAANADQFIQNIYEKVDPNDKGSLERIVVAGQKMMFSKETHQYMTELLDGEGEMEDKIGMGIVQLMMVLYQQSKGSMPPQLIMPAASILLAKACVYVEKTGGEMNTQIFGEALKLMAVGLHRQLSKTGGDQQEQEQPGAMPGEQQQPGGLVDRAMMQPGAQSGGM